MNELEARLTDHLAEEAEPARPEFRLDDVMLGTTTVRAMPVESSSRNRLRPLVAAAAVAAVTVGGLAVVSQRTESPSSSRPPALPVDLPTHGAVWRLEDSVTLFHAGQVATQECMAEEGWDYPIADISTSADRLGGWEPHLFLGVRTVAAAEELGYHPNLQDVVGPATFADTLAPAERDRFLRDLNGGADAETIAVDNGDGSTDRTFVAGGCFRASSPAFDDLAIQQDSLRVFVHENGIDQVGLARQAERDPRIIEVVETWRTCLDDAVGESAASPNELARRYAFEESTTSREIEVAVADATCQAETDLIDTWHQVYAEHQRAALGNAADQFDTLALMRVEIIARAEAILDERGIEIPDV